MDCHPALPLWSDGMTMEMFSTFDRLMISMGTQRDGASSSSRLQTQLTSTSLSLTPVFDSANDVSGVFAIVWQVSMNCDRLRRTEQTE